jgi:hypothetical protein
MVDRWSVLCGVAAVGNRIRMVFGGFVAPEAPRVLRFGDVEGGMEEPGVLPGDSVDDDVDAYNAYPDDGTRATPSFTACKGESR